MRDVKNMAQRGRKSADHLAALAFNRARSLQTATQAELTYWRRAYDEAWRTGFRFDTDGQRHWIEDAEGRRRHYELFDIPSALIAEWDAERRRQ
jgi:hypothetical protein